MHFDLHDPTFWVMIAFFGFIGLLYYYKVHKVVGKALQWRMAMLACAGLRVA